MAHGFMELMKERVWRYRWKGWEPGSEEPWGRWFRGDSVPRRKAAWLFCLVRARDGNAGGGKDALV